MTSPLHDTGALLLSKGSLVTRAHSYVFSIWPVCPHSCQKSSASLPKAPALLCCSPQDGKTPVAKAKDQDKNDGALDRPRSPGTPKAVPLQGDRVALAPMKSRENGFSPNSKPQLITWSQLAPLRLRLSQSHSCTGVSAPHSSPSATPGLPSWTGHRAKTNHPLSSHPLFLKSKEHHFSQTSLFLSLICVLTL